MKIKVPVKDLKKENVGRMIEEKLKGDIEHAYTITGLLVELFNIKMTDIENKSFRDWPKGIPTKYTKIRLHLEKLVRSGLVEKNMDGRAGVYWWVGNNTK